VDVALNVYDEVSQTGQASVPSAFSIIPASVHFTPQNWDQTLDYTVTFARDGVVQLNALVVNRAAIVATIESSTADADYLNDAQDTWLGVRVQETDAYGPDVSPLRASLFSSPPASGGIAKRTQTITVKLQSKPSDVVTISSIVSDELAITSSPTLPL